MCSTGIARAGFGAKPRSAAASSVEGATRSSASGFSDANGSSTPARRARLRSARRTSVSMARAASLNVLHSRSLASRRSRSSKRRSSSSSSTSSSDGSNRRAFRSTSVAAMSRNSVVTSRSKLSIRWSSPRYSSTIRESEISHRSTSCLRIRCRSRSNGPSKTDVDTSYDIAFQRTGALRRYRAIPHGCRRSRR